MQIQPQTSKNIDKVTKKKISTELQRVKTLFRIYPGRVSRFDEEVNGECTRYEVEETNLLNEQLFDP